ncbi:MAG: pseudouridine synthase [Holophagaceae bacterium]|nr:pseudouridine synthase [Holophagaceae bacterium]
MRTPAPKGPRTAPTTKRSSTSRPAARPGTRPAARTEAPAEAHSETRSAGRTSRPAARSTAPRPSRANARPATRPGARTAARAEAPAEARSEARPAGRTSRPASRSEAPRAPRTDARPATRPGAKPAAGSRPNRRPAAPVAPAPKPAPVRKAAPRIVKAGQERLQKILAAAGIASRRACETIILGGHVQVNGKTITELGTLADPRRDVITVDLQPIQREDPVYILMNKPKGYVTTVKDDRGRPTVMALLHGVEGRLYPVGRLDFNSEGLLLMTNDGALAKVLMGPEHEIPKVYLVKVHRNPTNELIKEFQEGFLLSGQRLKPCHIEVAEKGDNPWLKVTLTEGKNQQIRRMFAAVGHPVSKLRRVQFGPLADPLLKPGTWRFLSPQEIAAIKSL